MASTQVAQLATAAGAGAQTPAQWQGGAGTVFIEGSGLGAGVTAAIEAQGPNGTWINIVPAVTAPTVASINVAACQLRAVIVGAANAYIRVVPNPDTQLFAN